MCALVSWTTINISSSDHASLSLPSAMHTGSYHLIDYDGPMNDALIDRLRSEGILAQLLALYEYEFANRNWPTRKTETSLIQMFKHTLLLLRIITHSSLQSAKNQGNAYFVCLFLFNYATSQSDVVFYYFASFVCGCMHLCVHCIPLCALLM